MKALEEINAIFWSLLDPWRFMCTTLPFLYTTILRLIEAADYVTLWSWHSLQNAWFSAFWLWFGPQLRAGSGDRITALLEGRVQNAQIVPDPVAPHVNGAILDIGPGRGHWIDLYDKSSVPIGRAGNVAGIQKVYGVEPNPDSHAALFKRVEESGLTDIYEIIPVGIESLNKASVGHSHRVIEKGSIDCIVSILCLCSIPEPEKNIAELYSYLKHGGRWYLYEHVQTKASTFMKLYQGFVNIFWPFALGGCELCRDTEQYLRNAGPWDKIDLAQPPTEPWHETVPHILGILTK